MLKVLCALEVLYPKRGALYVNVKCYSEVLCNKSHDFIAIFALAHSKINQIA